MSEPSRFALTFAALFQGREDAYGLGRGEVVKQPLMLEHYRAHLAGDDSGIGVFPLRDDGTVSFAAIDLDEPDFELIALLRELLPGTSWIERSRSGNAHLWAFFESPVEAWIPRGLMKRALESVAREDVEVFPKQDRLRAGMVGNYINLPFHGSARPIIHLPEHDGATGFDYAAPQFVAAAWNQRNDPEDWRRRAEAQGIVAPELRETTSEFGEQAVLHVCAEYIIEGVKSGERPLLPGHRHQVLFHLACQLFNYVGFDQEEASALVRETNQESPDPLPDAEIDRLLRNAWVGQFTFTGCDDPVMAPYVSPECKITGG